MYGCQQGVALSGSSVAAGLIKSLSFLDRFLALWIVLAMIVGVVCGYFIKGLPQAFSVVDIQGTSLPIAFGLWFMMWPVLSKVIMGRDEHHLVAFFHTHCVCFERSRSALWM